MEIKIAGIRGDNQLGAMGMSDESPRRNGTAFRHEAVFYDGLDSYADRLHSFVTGALETGEPILMMVPPDRIELMRDALGSEAQKVQFEDMTVVGRNPARIIPAWREFADTHARPGLRLRGVGEPIWKERSPDELEEGRRHEALLNTAFGDAFFWLVCPYDTTALDGSVLDAATRTHPHTDGRPAVYQGAPSPQAMFAGDLPAPPTGHRLIPFQIDTVRDIRSAALHIAATAGLDDVAADNFALAAHELAVNSVLHGGGSGTARLWASGKAAVAEVADAGLIDRPMIGRIRPAVEQENGRGVWLANQLCDLVQIRSGSDGTVVRIHLSSRR